MSTKGLLTLIAVLLFGVFSVIFLQAIHQSPEEQMADSFGKLTQDIGGAIQNQASVE